MQRKKEESGIFESLQEKKTMDDYGGVLGRLTCMYIRMIDKEDEFGENEHGLRVSQRQRVQDLKVGLVDKVGNDEMDVRFHAMLKQLFFWHESYCLMDVLDCPIQRFLVYASYPLCCPKRRQLFGVRPINALIGTDP